MTGERMVKTTVTIPEDLYLLARHYGLKNLGEFVRDALQGFVDGQEEPVSDTVAVRARQIAVDLRLKSMQQRKIVQDMELDREVREAAVRTRKDLIASETLIAIRRLGFRKEMILDDQHFTWQRKRDELADAVSDACRLDLQWKDIEQAVKVAVKT